MTLRKHIDIVAVGLLLGGIALCSHINRLVAFEVNNSRISFTRQYHPPRVVIPEVPRIPFTRD